MHSASVWMSSLVVAAAGGWFAATMFAGPATGREPRFPQMTMDPEAKIAAGEHEWEPNFVDYLFLAFITSTAFSPTDTAVLSRWAKILMMIQAMISLLVIALLAGRAVNIL